MVQMLPTADLLKFLGFTVAANRTTIINELCPNGPQDMIGKDVKQFAHTCNAFKDRATGAFTVTDYQLTMLVSLVHWVTRNHAVNLTTNFRADAEQVGVIAAVREATRWHDALKSRTDKGNSYLTEKFSTKLDNQTQWKTWSFDLNRALSMIIGERGISVDYVIRKNANPTSTGTSFAERAYNAARLDPNIDAYVTDMKTVHNVILSNIDAMGSAYGYIVRLRSQMNGRSDILALRSRFEAAGVTNLLVQTADNELLMLVYKNERALPFELFRAKLVRCYEVLEENGCLRNDNEKIKVLWPKIQAPYLEHARANLMMQHTLQNMTFEAVLDHFAILIPQLAGNGTGFTSRIQQVGVINGTALTHEGSAPQHGAHLADGSLFTGKYTSEQWHSESVKPHHNDIKAARAAHRIANGGEERKRGGKTKRANYFQRGKREVKKLKATVASLESKISSLSNKNSDSENPSPQSGKDSQLNNTDAGNAFGGRQGKRKSKKG